jgi:redox-sensitive bicupin YhaK (pirin superfamily)
MERTAEMEPGHFELGKVGVGMEHEMIMPKNWAGYLHGFQLWVNLPSANKFDAPHFQNVSPSKLPKVEIGDAKCKIMHGTVGSTSSPTTCELVPWQYIDFELASDARASHEVPKEMTTCFVCVNSGTVDVCGTAVDEMTVALFRGDGLLELKAISRQGSSRLRSTRRPKTSSGGPSCLIVGRRGTSTDTAILIAGRRGTPTETATGAR